MHPLVNPRIGPGGLICKNEFLDGGLIEGKAYSGGGLFHSLASSSKLDNFFAIITKVAFRYAFLSPVKGSKGSVIYNSGCRGGSQLGRVSKLFKEQLGV